MTAQTRKRKMISLRLSEQEYETMRALLPKFGARTVSDFARLAMQRTISNSFASDSSLDAKLKELDRRLDFMEARVSSLMGVQS
jgi:hypothetical protein